MDFHSRRLSLPHHCLPRTSCCLEGPPEWISNTFYNSIPCGPGSALYWFVFVLATLATVIASQAMILGTFSIVFQAKNELIVDSSSDATGLFSVFDGHSQGPKVVGRVYIPLINWYGPF